MHVIKSLFVIIVFFTLTLAGCQSKSKKSDDSKNEAVRSINDQKFVRSETERTASLTKLKEQILIATFYMTDEEVSYYLAAPQTTDLALWLPHITINSEHLERFRAEAENLGVQHRDMKDALLRIGVWGYLHKKTDIVDRFIESISSDLNENEFVINPLPIINEQSFDKLEKFFEVKVASVEKKDAEPFEKLRREKLLQAKYTADSLLNREHEAFRLLMSRDITTALAVETKDLFAQLGVKNRITRIVALEMWLRLNEQKSLLKDFIILEADFERSQKYKEYLRDKLNNQPNPFLGDPIEE